MQRSVRPSGICRAIDCCCFHSTDFGAEKERSVRGPVNHAGRSLSKSRKERARPSKAVTRMNVPADHWRRSRTFVVVTMLLAAGSLVYANGFSNPFLLDDVNAIVENPNITAGPFWHAFISSPNSPLAGRPLVQLTFAANYAIGGLSVDGYHLVNFAFHLVCAFLVFLIVRETLQTIANSRTFSVPADLLAGAVALLWMVHPLNSEVVEYVTERTEPMMAACFLLALYSSIRAIRARRPIGWQATSVLACLVGAACKETIAVAPIAVFLYDRTFVFHSFRTAFQRRWRFYLIQSATTWSVLGVLLWTMGQSFAAGAKTADVSTWHYFLHQPPLLIRYLWLTMWPHALVLYYGASTPVTLREVWPYVAVVTALFGIALVQVLRGRPFGFLAFWIFLTLGPTSSFVVIAMEVGAERRMYLPLAGIITMAVVAGAWLCNRLTQGKHRTQMFVVLMTMIAIPLSIRTISRNREYSTPLVMARTVLERWPIPSSHYIVGMELSAAGDHEGAIRELRLAAPQWPLARFRLGLELINTGRLSEGAATLESFISDEPKQPTTPIAHGQLANIFSDEQRFDEAIPQYRAYLDAYPSDADAWNAFGIAEMRTFRLDDALESFGNAVRLRPRDARLWMNLGNALRSKGRIDDARRAFKSALDTDPSFAPAAAALQELQAGR